MDCTAGEAFELAVDEMVAILQLACYEVGLGTKMSVRNEIGVYRQLELSEDGGPVLDFAGVIRVDGPDCVKVARHRREFAELDVTSPNFFRQLFRHFYVEDTKIMFWYEGHKPFSRVAGLGTFEKPCDSVP